MEERILEYLRADKEKRGGWSSVSIVTLQNKFGINIKNELNSLYAKKMIKVSNGINNKLIQLL